jgi:hypothetical protein
MCNYYLNVVRKFLLVMFVTLSITRNVKSMLVLGLLKYHVIVAVTWERCQVD